MYQMAGSYTFTGHGAGTLGHGGLDLSASMFARMCRHSLCVPKISSMALASRVALPAVQP
jgi:hypothetical protein